MNKCSDPTLTISLEMLYLEPAGLRFKIRGEEGSGEVYILDRQIRIAEFGDLIGVAAIRAILDRKDHWCCENEESFPQIISWNICIEQVLLDLLARPAGFSEEELSQIRKGGGATLPEPGLRGTQSGESYDIHLSVQGGPWDGHTFALFPGENPISRLEYSVMEAVESPGCYSIFLDENGVKLSGRKGDHQAFLNGTPVREADLADGDELLLGKLKIKLHFIRHEPVSISCGSGKKTEDLLRPIAEQEPSWRDAKTINWKQFAPKKMFS